MQNQPFVCHSILKVVTDQNQKVTDFEFLEVDQPFEQFFKPIVGTVCGELFSQVLSKITDSEADVVETFKRAYENNTTQITEIFCQPLDIYFRIQAAGTSDDTLTVYFADSSAEHYLERQLVERRKEFKAILLLSELDDIKASYNRMLPRLVEKIPESWQYPEQTCCKITLNGDEVTSQNYKPTQWQLRSVIRKGKQESGYIEVGYLTAFPSMDVGPFMREEKELLDEIAGRLSKILENNAIYNELQSNQSLLDKASAMANMGAWSVDLSTQKVTWSDQVARIHECAPGYSPDVSEGISFYAPEFQGKIADLFRRCIEDGISYNEEMAIITAKGNRRWVKTIGEAVRDEQGKIVKVQGAFQDITEIIETQQALIEHEKMLNAMISASPIAIYSIGTDGTVYSWNKASEKIFGWTEQEALGKKLPIVPKHKQEEHEEIVERILAGDSITELELTRQKKDGKFIEISLSTAPITNENQQIVSILAIASDITGRKKKEDQILLHSTALNSVANAVIITDRDGNIEWVNRAWSDLTGYQEEEVLGENPRILKSGVQDESYYEELWDTILSGKVWTGELINKKKDGTLYHELQTITPLMDAEGKISHLIGIKQDITKQKKTEKELRELVREKDVLLSEVHHRVKNNMAMLSAIMYLELIQTENEDVSDNIQKNIHRIDTIASVHELVYASEKWSKVNLEKIALKLVESAGQDDESDCNVRITVDSSAAFINVNQALPASMIINEMFRGMYKAACREERKSILNIEVLESGGKIQISISKKGTNGQSGIPEMIGVPGMQLIDTLTQQLNGSVEYDTTADKTEVQLIFDRDDSVSGTSSAFLV